MLLQLTTQPSRPLLLTQSLQMWTATYHPSPILPLFLPKAIRRTTTLRREMVWIDWSESCTPGPSCQWSTPRQRSSNQASRPLPSERALSVAVKPKRFLWARSRLSTLSPAASKRSTSSMRLRDRPQRSIPCSAACASVASVTAPTPVWQKLFPRWGDRDQ